MALGLTQPLAEMNTRDLPARKADSLTAICEPIVYKPWDSRRLKTLQAPAPC
jgi:hypothetical protein